MNTDLDVPWSRRIAPLHAQYAMQWGIKRLLYLDNDGVRFRRDLAVMWRHIQSARPLTAPDRVEAVERLLAATAESGGERCTLTAFVQAHRRHLIMPVLDDEQWAGLSRHLEPAVRALLAEARERSGEG